MFRKPLIVLILLCLPAYAVFSQQRQGQGPRRDISGKVIDSTDNQPMPMVQVGISELSHWTVTNMEGHFNLRNVPAGKHVLTIRCLGYTTIEKEFNVPEITEINIKLTPASLALGEVVVTAQRGTGISTSTTIGRSAIEHTQPSSISDIMQLMPGEVARNPNLSSVNQLSIREPNVTSAGPTAMASMGTGIRIDGAPVDNLANMQMLSTATGTGIYQTTAGSGTDMRQFPVDNIESIEVIRGIPGVEEGNVLSGVVNINLIRGATPLTTRVKVDPNIKQVYVGKGFNLSGASGGTLNMDTDFQQSLSDVRWPNQSFNRFSGYLAYSNTFYTDSRPLRFTASARYYDQRNRNVDDPDLLREESRTSHDQTLALTLSGRWALNSLLLTNLNWNLSGNFQWQNSREKTFRNFQSVRALAISPIPGEHEAIFLYPGYYSDVVIEGRPISINSRLSGTRTFELGSTQHTLRAGMDFSYRQNKGRGSMFDRTQPPDATSSAGVRPRPFYDIPGYANLALFLGEEMTLPIGSTKLDIHAGIRFENIQPDGPFTSKEGLTSLDPRINARYHIFSRRDHLISNLGFRLGYGKTTLTPGLFHLYPDKAYRDLNSFNYFDPPGSLAVNYTHVVEDTRNYNLRPAKASKIEAGLDIKIGRFDMQFTGYYDVETDGFRGLRTYYPVAFNRYERLSVPNLAPRFEYGVGVVYNDPVTGDQVVVSSRPDTVLVAYNTFENNLDNTKYGLEMEIDFGRVDPIHTSFMLSGAYRVIHRQDTKEWFATSTAVSDLVVGLYPAGNDGKYESSFNTTVRTVTHIRPLAMVVSLTGQALWMDRYTNTYEDRNGNILVHTPEPTDDPYGDITQRKYINPVAVMDLSGKLIPWQDDFAETMPYASLIREFLNENFVPITRRPAFQLNMRLTKELSRKATLSFSVNNLTYYQPLQTSKGRVNESYLRRNSKTYFSGELTIKL